MSTLAADLLFPKFEDEWEDQRATIERLYLDEGRQLKEVIEIMQKDYQFKATVNMYKQRIRRWGLDKRQKRPEMLACVRKQTERTAIGKRSDFYSRGRKVNFQSMLRFMERSHLTIEDVVALNAPTPPALEVHTPTPSSASSCPNTPDVTIVPEQLDGGCTPSMSPSSLECFQRAMTPLHRFTVSPDISETFLFTMKDYMTVKFESGHWVKNGDHCSSLTDPSYLAARALGIALDNLDVLLSDRISRNIVQSPIDAAILKNKAVTMFRNSIADEPAILPRFIACYIHFLYSSNDQGSLLGSEVSGALAEAAAMVFGTYQHPVCRLLDLLRRMNTNLDSKFELEGHRLISDVFEMYLGVLGYETVALKAEAAMNCDNKIYQLSQLLKRVRHIGSGHMVCYISSLAFEAYFAIDDLEKAEHCLRESLETAQACNLPYFEVVAFNFIAMLRHKQGNIGAAIQNQYMAFIRLDSCSSKHPQKLEMLATLQRWALERQDLEEIELVRQWKLRETFRILYEEDCDEVGIPAQTGMGENPIFR